MAAPHLSIFAGDDEGEPSGDVRLKEAFDQFLRPQLERRKRSPSHIRAFYTILEHWQRLTPDPPVRLIDDALLQQFSDALLVWYQSHEMRGTEAVSKALRYLRSIFRACAERGPGNPRGVATGKHVLTYVPIAEPPERSMQRKRIATLAELGAAYEACQVAKWPKPRRRSLWAAPAPLLWRVLLVLDYTYGPRTENLLGLEWANIVLDTACPAPDASRLHWPHGWLTYVPGKTKRHKPDPLYLPLTECARMHLEELRLRNRTGPIFAFPRNKHALHNTRQRIWTEADIADPYTFQEIRKTCSTAWNDLYPLLGEHVTGHAPRSVNQIHYDTAIRRLMTYANKVPMAPEFLRGIGLNAEANINAREELMKRVGSLSDEAARLLLKLSEKIQ